MSRDNPPSITKLLRDWREGDSVAFAEVAALVDCELRRLAASYMSRERVNHTLQPTALINEAYLRLIGQSNEVDWQSRSHFVAIAAQHMRQILVDYARRHQAGKRGGGVNLVSLEDDRVPVDAPSTDILALNEALEKLAQVDERKARVLELKYFGGLGMAEIAGNLGVSIKTVEKDARVAGAWLRATLSGAASTCI